MLATPVHDQSLDLYYTHALVHSIRACAQKEIVLNPVWWPGEALVQHARNMLVEIAIEKKVDDIVFVDSDQEWAPDDMVRLLGWPVDVVGVPIRLKQEVEQYNVRASGFDFPVDKATGLWIVEAVGTGIMRVSAKALREVWNTSTPYSKNGQKCRMVFGVDVVSGELHGEDVGFCEKLKKCGFPIYVDQGIEAGHIGRKKYVGVFAEYVSKVNQMRRAEERASETYFVNVGD